MIKLLENNLINKIAAGEVVERPVSVVKELVENAIDAGSTNITIEISDGGTSLIRITDNGKGILKSDVKTAFLRHATSKISSFEDLESVLSLGFRGEALSSISSVSQVEMITKSETETTGTRIEIHGGQVISEGDIGSANGTTILIRNLFYNTPARRKFLKKSSVESGYISEMINKLSFSHPEVSFKYVNNNSVVTQTKGNGDLKTTIFQVYGKDISKNLLEVNSNKHKIKLTGFIAKPEVSRGNRSYEHFFINGRHIKNEIVRSAVEQAYKTKLPIGKFPIFILKMEIDPSRVDVNVHPTKLEVRFSEGELIYEYVLETISKVLESTNLIPEVTWAKENKPVFEKPKNITIGNYVAERYVPESLPQATSFSDLIFQMDNDKNISHQIKEDAKEITYESLEFKKDIQQTVEEVKAPKKLFFNNYKIIGQVFNTYWIVEQEKSLYLIDQHAGHERILFEQLTNKFKNEKISSQKLIEPIAVNLSLSEMEIYKQNENLLKDFGFEVEEFGDRTVALRAVPYILECPANVDFFIEIIDRLSSVDTSVSNIFELKMEKIASISCKAAVKANDKLSYMEAKTLIEKILKLENPFTCPHGRPTIIEMTKYELEKNFKRIT